MKRCVQRVLHIGHNIVNKHLAFTIDTLKDMHADVISSIDVFRGETTIILESRGLLQVCKTLRYDSQLDYNLLVDIVSKDCYPEEPRFSLSYMLHALDKNARFRICINLSDENPEVDSVTECWKSAEWPEREAFDLMGISFVGHPDLRRILMPADWDGHPLRKDYPLGYEEVQFSFNWKEIDEKKDYAEE